MAKQNRRDSRENSTTNDSASQSQVPAVPPPDDPLRRGTEFDPDREYKSREMAEKRLEAIRQTRKMPTSYEEASESELEQTGSDTKPDSK